MRRRIVVDQDEMLMLITDTRQRHETVTFGFGPTGCWLLPKEDRTFTGWAVVRLAEKRGVTIESLLTSP